MAHPPAPPLPLSRKQERKVRTLVAAAGAGQAVVRRARIVLLAAAGRHTTAIAAELGCSVSTVRSWRERFRRRGVAGLFDRPRSGRPEQHGPSARLAVVATATSVPPEGATLWTRATIAAHLAERGLVLSPSTVGRVLAEAKVRPHRVRGWLNRADDDAFWSQAGAVCHLYLGCDTGDLAYSAVAYSSAREVPW